MSPNNTPTPSKNQGVAPESLDALVEALWQASVRAALRKANKSPYVETQDCYLTGREGIGKEMVEKILTHPLYDATDEWHENGLDYAANERTEACKQVIKDALKEPAAQTLIELAAESWDEDEDDTQERALDALEERAREEGLDSLYEVEFELRGTAEAKWEESFQLPFTQPENDIYLPAFNQQGSDWMMILLWLNIEPSSFLNVCRDRAKAELRRLKEETSPEEWADCEPAQEIKEWLQEQGLGRPCPKNPRSWPSELDEAYREAALKGWSFPKGPPACSPDALLDALSKADNGDPSLSMDLSIQADDLTESSLLIDWLSEGGPILAPSQLTRLQQASPGQLFIDSESVSLSSPLTIKSDDIRFTEYSGDDGLLLAVDRELRTEAKEMEQATRSPGGYYFGQADEESFADELESGADRTRAYAQKASHEGLAQAEDRLNILAKSTMKAEAKDEPVEKNEMAAERARLYSEVLLAALHQGAAKSKKVKAKTSPKKIHELLDIGPYGLKSSSWRSEALRAIDLAERSGKLDQPDPLGNTLFRKAVLTADANLCADLLKRGANPSVANLIGEPAWSALIQLSVKDQIRMVEALGPFGVAEWRNQQGKTLLHHINSIEPALALAKLGSDPSAQDLAGNRADYRIYSEKAKTQLEAAFLEAATPAAPIRIKSSLSL